MGMLDTLHNPAMVHALAVHAPISLAFLGVPLVILAASFKEKGATIRWLAVAAYLGLTVAAVITVQTGVGAREALPNEAGVIEEPVWRLVHNHEDMAEKVWVFALVTTLFTACTAAQGPRLRVAAGVLAVLAAIATAGWIGLTGHYGGTLVYVHGLGTPALEFKQQLIAQGQTPAPPVSPGPEAPEPAAAVPLPAAPGAVVPAPVAPPPAVVETETAIPAPPVREVSYVREVVPILEENCYGCHGKASGLNLETIDAMLAGGKKAGPAVRAGLPDESPLIKYVNGALQPRMPKDGDPLTGDEVATLHAWIATGMKDDSPD